MALVQILRSSAIALVRGVKNHAQKVEILISICTATAETKSTLLPMMIYSNSDKDDIISDGIKKEKANQKDSIE